METATQVYLPGLPEGVEPVGFHAPKSGEFTIFGEYPQPAMLNGKQLIVRPAKGFRFQYDIVSGHYRVIPT